MRLHAPVLFLFDRPNPAKNFSMEIPLVGTKEYKTLLNWVAFMNLDITHCSMHFRSCEPRFWEISNEYRIVALDPATAGYHHELNEERLAVIRFFELPPPGSDVDKKKLTSLLIRCREFIYK